MSRRSVEVDGVATLISPLKPPMAIDRSCALMRIAVREETTNQSPLATLSARLIQPAGVGAAVRVVDSGLVGVSGRPGRAFSPTLASTGRIEVEIAAARFITRRVAVDFACGLRKLASAASTAVLTLDSAAGLTAGQRLLIGTPTGAALDFATITATGPGANDVTIAQVPSFPFPVGSTVQPLPADQLLDLRRAVVSIRGRILKKTGTTIAPLANANVSITKIWRQLPKAGTTTPPEPPVPATSPAPPWPAPIASIWPPIYADVPGGTTLDVEDRAVDGGMPAKTLLDDVPGGATELRLSDRQLLAVSDVLAFDADDPARREIVVVLKVAGAGAADDWARVTINHPLALLHRRGAVVRRLQNPVVSLSKPLNYDAARGDEVVLFDASAYSGVHQVCLSPGTPVSSFHRLTQFAVRSDADGFYRLPPLTRAGKIEVYAKDSGSSADRAVEHIPDYQSAENQLDITV